MSNSTPEVVVRDSMNKLVPACIHSDWNEAEATGDRLLKQIVELKVTVETLQHNNSMTIRGVNTQAVIAWLTNAYTEIRMVLPYVVCPTCHGVKRDTCRTCKQRGFISKFFYDHCIPAELKALVKK